MPNLFERRSEFADKDELAKNETLFCVMAPPDLRDTVYGEKWFIEISYGEKKETLTFGRTEKRDADYMEAASHPEWYPQHRCYLRAWSINGKSGHHLNQKNGSGVCPCTPGQEAAEEAFIPPLKLNNPTVIDALENAQPSMQQVASIGKLSVHLDRNIDIPSTYGEARSLIISLNAEYNLRSQRSA